MAQKTKTAAELKPAHKICLQGFDTLPDSAEVPVQVVAALNAVTVVSIWRWARDGKISAPKRRGGVTRWNVGELRLSMAAKA